MLPTAKGASALAIRPVLYAKPMPVARMRVSDTRKMELLLSRTPGSPGEDLEHVERTLRAGLGSGREPARVVRSLDAIFILSR